MRHIKRLAKPDILEKKAKEWTEKFLASDKPRPDGSKYRHEEILSQLRTMSHSKCFYCETLLKGVPDEIDHYIEVSDKDCNGKSLAFEWKNLYLACDNCNNKEPNTSIPVSEALNPCENTDIEIENALYFEDEQICYKTNIGEQTIIKFKLGSEKLDNLRMKMLKIFHKKLISIQNINMKEGKTKLLDEQKEELRQFAKNNQPFSLMFRNILKNNGI